MIYSINNFAHGWLEYFSYAIAQNTLFLALVFLALYFMRNASARIKYVIAVLGLVKLLLPPFLPGSFGSAAFNTPESIHVGSTITVLPAEPMMPQLSVPGMLLLLWGVMIFLYLILSALSTLRLFWRLRKASFLKNVFVDEYFVGLYQSPNISVPMSLGIRPSCIYLPDSWSDLSSAQQESLLRHEVAHIQRWDGLYFIFQVIAQAVYLFHPLVWLLNARINEYREMACDDIAIERSHVTPLMYSRCLVHVAEKILPTWGVSSASALIKQRNKLYHRVNYIVKETNNMKTLSPKKSWLIFAVLLLMIAPLSWYCSKEAPPEAENTSISSNQESAATGKIYGQVTSSTTGKPLAGMSIVLKGTSLKVKADENGNYYFVNVPPGIYELGIPFQSGYQTAQADVKVSVGQSTQVNFAWETVDPEAKPDDSVSDADTASGPYDVAPEPVGGFEAITNNLTYPEAALKAGVQGRVFVNALIDETGKVTETKIIKSLGDTGCDEAAAAAIKATKWTPAQKNGRPVAVWVAIPVSFKLK